MGKREKEARTKQVQLVQPEHVANALRFKAQRENKSINELANDAIDRYIKSGGENIVADNNCRMVLMMQPSQYALLSEMAKAQGISVNTAVKHALTVCITGEQTDSTANRLITYISITGTLRGRVQAIASAVNRGHGAAHSIMERITDLREKKLPKSKDPERYKEIMSEVDRLWDTVCSATEEVNEICGDPEI